MVDRVRERERGGLRKGERVIHKWLQVEEASGSHGPQATCWVVATAGQHFPWLGNFPLFLPSLHDMGMGRQRDRGAQRVISSHDLFKFCHTLAL